MTLKLSLNENPWEGDTIELNMSFDNLRDYQWERLLKALWNYPGMTGPLETRYIPGQEVPAPAEMIIPKPTDALAQFAVFEVAPDVKAGAEILITRSLFECVSVAIPVNMFSEDTDLDVVGNVFYEMALQLYETTTYTIAAIGINRECQLLMEIIARPELRDKLIKTGNFLARDDALAELRLLPRHYQEVKPSLRWCPPKN